MIWLTAIAAKNVGGAQLKFDEWLNMVGKPEWEVYRLQLIGKNTSEAQIYKIKAKLMNAFQDYACQHELEPIEV